MLKNRIVSKIIICCIIFIMMPIFAINTGATSASNITYFGTTIPCKKDNGYVPATTPNMGALTTPNVSAIPSGNDNPHNGWSLGAFYVSGYSGTTSSNINAYSENMPVYLKNVGDTVSFGFKLDQNIDSLNGNKKLVISDDRKVLKDCWVQDPYISGDLGRGVLIIVHTDYKGEQKISTYRDFLTGKSVGANTEVQLFEEGDYRVILCYEIYNDTSWNWIVDWTNPNASWYNYRIESYFSVRNGNAMVYPFDIGTGSELSNKGVTESGFKVDLAKSRYLNLTVKKENLNESQTAIVEDTRFNKVVSDNSEFTDEGKYTITVTNPYTNAVTEKVIYVGTNPLMRCHIVMGLDIQEINSYLQMGYTINEDGTLSDKNETKYYEKPENISNLKNNSSTYNTTSGGCMGTLSYTLIIPAVIVIFALAIMLRKVKEEQKNG